MSKANGTAQAGAPVSILDTDLYKLTMQQAVLQHYPDAQVSYRFTNRSKDMRFTRACVHRIQTAVDQLAHISLTSDEKAFLERVCPYLKPAYVSYLAAYRFDPSSQVRLRFVPSPASTSTATSSSYSSEQNSEDPERTARLTNGEQSESAQEWGELEIEVEGVWKDVILYEVPLMAIVSEAYFTMTETRWDLRGQRALAAQKSRALVSKGIRYSEFGTRRRRSYVSHRLLIEGLLRGEKEALESGTENPGKLLGTSNVHFAQMFDLAPVGTVAHEWTMGIAALEGYPHSNLLSLKKWDETYQPPHFVPNSPAHDLTIALTDTFSTKVFFEDLLSSEQGREIARRWRGLRQDSGDSMAFARRAKQVYEDLGVDAMTKVVIYSDGLNVERCLELADYSKQIGIGAGFGIGTNLTNDFRLTPSPDAEADPDAEPRKGETSKALNIVIKLYSINGKHAVKISDDLTKNTGDAEEVKMVKRRFGLEGVEHVEDA